MAYFEGAVRPLVVGYQRRQALRRGCQTEHMWQGTLRWEGKEAIVAELCEAEEKTVAQGAGTSVAAGLGALQDARWQKLLVWRTHT